MKLITDNYIIIIVVGLFLIFALIGYLIDILRNNKDNETKTSIPDEISAIEVTEINETKEDEKKVELENNPDELLENYDKEN